MKLKSLLVAFGLAAATSFAIALGVSANQNAKPVHAEGETWMINASVDMGTYLTGLDGFDDSNLLFRCGMDGKGDWAEAKMYPSGSPHVYNVNIAFGDAFAFNRIQVKFKQGEADKYSVAYSISGSKETHYQAYYLTASGEGVGAWEGDNWKVSGNGCELGFEYDEVPFDITEDIPNRRFICSNVELENNYSKYFNFYYRHSWNFLYDSLTNSAKEYIGASYADNWISFKTAGHYDIILKSDGADGGILDFKLRESSESYIYYVTQSSSATEDYIYTYGADEAFGAWPGTKVKSVPGVVELFGDSEDFKFNHSSYDGSKNRRVYKIPLTIGYPKDDHVIFNYYAGPENPSNSKTDNMIIEAGCAYFWTAVSNWRNPNDGIALDFITKVEAARKAAASESICSLTTEKAKELYDEYNALYAAPKNIINQCELYTWTDNTKTAKANVSYGDVMNRIGIIGGVVVESAYVSVNFMENSNTTTFTVVAVIAGALAVGLGLFFVAKKTRRQ